MFIRLLVLLTSMSLYLVTSSVSAQSLYSKAYGKDTDKPVIYIHGGPRGNATLFEGTTAQCLADEGFYVIVYDRRGEGRSPDATAKLTFAEAFQDLNNLLDEYQLEKVSLIGHSFGRLVSTLYTEAFPDKVENLILVGALFSQQESYDHILDSCTTLAQLASDSATLQKIHQTKTLDKNSADYRSMCYEVAAKYGFFKMPNPTDEQRKLQERYDISSFGKNNIRNNDAPLLFYQNEKLVNIDTKTNLRELKKKNINLTGIYGEQDGIFSQKQVLDIRDIVGPNDFYTIDNCSHYPFVDQQDRFIAIIKKVLARSSVGQSHGK